MKDNSIIEQLYYGDLGDVIHAVDDCEEAKVSSDKYQELLTKLREVLNDEQRALLDEFELVAEDIVANERRSGFVKGYRVATGLLLDGMK